MRSSYQRNLKTKESLLWFQESRNKWEQAKRRKVVALPPPLPPYSPSSAQRIIDDEEDQVPPPPPQESTIEQLTSLTLNGHPETQSSEEIARQAYRDRLIDFYEKHNPSKLDTVETTLDAFRGQEDVLFQKLEAKYLETKSATVGATPSPYLPPGGTGPVCFLEFNWGESQMPKRVVIQLFYDKAPLACENFRCFCTGELGTGRLGKPLCYRYSKIHRVVPKFCVQGGDFTKGDGTGGESIYPPNSEHGDMWGKFRDETPFLQHSRKGLLSMANNGPNRNGSQFFFTLRPLSSLDGKHVVFGEILEGMDVIDAIGGLSTNEKQRPIEPVVISDCGEIKPNGQEIRASTGSSQPESDDRNKGGQNGFGGNTPFGGSRFSFGNAAAFSSTSFASSFGSLSGGAGFFATKNADASIPNVAASANTPSQLPAAGSIEIKASGFFSLQDSASIQTPRCEQQTNLEHRAAPIDTLSSTSILSSTINAPTKTTEENKGIASISGPLSLSSSFHQKKSFQPLAEQLGSGLSNTTAIPITSYSSPISVSGFPGLLPEPSELSSVVSTEAAAAKSDHAFVAIDGLGLSESDNVLLIDWDRRGTISPKPIPFTFSSACDDDVCAATTAVTTSTTALFEELEVQLMLFNFSGFCATRALDWHQTIVPKPKTVRSEFFSVTRRLLCEAPCQISDLSLDDELGVLLLLKLSNHAATSALKRRAPAEAIGTTTSIAATSNYVTKAKSKGTAKEVIDEPTDCYPPLPLNIDELWVHLSLAVESPPITEEFFSLRVPLKWNRTKGNQHVDSGVGVSAKLSSEIDGNLENAELLYDERQVDLELQPSPGGGSKSVQTEVDKEALQRVITASDNLVASPKDVKAGNSTPAASQTSFERHEITWTLKGDEFSTALTMLLASEQNSACPKQVMITSEGVCLLPLISRRILSDDQASPVLKSLTDSIVENGLPLQEEAGLQADELGVLLSLTMQVRPKVQLKGTGSALTITQQNWSPEKQMAPTDGLSLGLGIAKSSDLHAGQQKVDELCVDERMAQLASEFPCPIVLFNQFLSSAMVIQSTKRIGITGTSAAAHKGRATGDAKELLDELDVQLALSTCCATTNLSKVSRLLAPRSVVTCSSPTLAKLRPVIGSSSSLSDDRHASPSTSCMDYDSDHLLQHNANDAAAPTTEFTFSASVCKPSTSEGDLLSLSSSTRTDEGDASESLRSLNGVEHKQLQMRLIAFAGKARTFANGLPLTASTNDCYPVSNHSHLAYCGAQSAAFLQTEILDGENHEHRKNVYSGSCLGSNRDVTRGDTNLVRPRPLWKCLSRMHAGSDDEAFDPTGGKTATDARHREQILSTALWKTGWTPTNIVISSHGTVTSSEQTRNKPTQTRHAIFTLKQQQQQQPKLNPKMILSIPSNQGLFSSVSAFSRPSPKLSPSSPSLTKDDDDEQRTCCDHTVSGVSDLVTFFEGLKHEYLGDVDLVASETIIITEKSTTLLSSPFPPATTKRDLDGSGSRSVEQLSPTPQVVLGFEDPVIFAKRKISLFNSLCCDEDVGDDTQSHDEGNASPTTPAATVCSECEVKSGCLETCVRLMQLG